MQDMKNPVENYHKQLPSSRKTDEQWEAVQSIARHIIAITENSQLYNDPEQNRSFIQSIDSCRIVRIETAAGTPPVAITFTYEPDKRLRHAEIPTSTKTETTSPTSRNLKNWMPYANSPPNTWPTCFKNGAEKTKPKSIA